MGNKKIKIFLFLLLLFFFLGASFVLAQKPLEITYPEIPGVLTPTTIKTKLPDYIRYIFQLSLFLAALAAFGSFVYGGVRYLTSAGSPSAQSDARSQITAGILGLIILISSYVILNTINPQLVALKVSLPETPPRLPPVAGPVIVSTATHIEIPLGGLIENLWGRVRASSPATYYPRPADCYDFDSNGDATLLLTDHDRLDCIKKLSGAIKIKAKKLQEPVEKLRELYDCWNCCEDPCENACNWNEEEEYWEDCGAYSSCEGKGRDATKDYCRAAACDYLPPCLAQDCLAIPFQGESSICRHPKTKKPCNYEDPIVQCLITKKPEKCDPDQDPYPSDLLPIDVALPGLQVKMGFYPLTEAMRKPENLDELLSNEDAKDLIIELLIGEPAEGNKLKEILKIREIMSYLIEEWQYRDDLLSDPNIAKTVLKALGFLENEIAINEIAWMGTLANENQEWIELYNNTEGEIDLTNWKLKTKSLSLDVNLSGIIPAQGFYLLENNENTVSDITADLIYSGNLDNGGEILELYDLFGNLVELVDCSSGWFAGDEISKTSMERINPKEKPERENWLTNFSIRVEEEHKKDFINGKDSGDNPIYGTPRNPNSVGVEIFSYPALNDLIFDLGRRLGTEESLREKAILLLRKDENLERMVKTKENLKEILVGEDERLKKLLSEREVLRILLEDENNLNTLLNDPLAGPHIQTVFRRALNMEGSEKDKAWEDLITNKLKESRINSKLINDFKRDLEWVLLAGKLMKGCEQDPISIDNLTVERQLIARPPEWKEIDPQFPPLDYDPATFYCYKSLWETPKR